MARHEWCAKAGREGCFRLGHTDLGAGDLRRVTGQEVIHRLLGRQTRDRRQDAERIRGQHDDILRHRPHIFFRGVGNEFDRIGTAGIFRLAVVVEIEFPRFRVHHDIFEYGSEPPRGRVDFRFRILGKPDHLGVAAALKIEYRSIRPAMFVIADQHTAGIRRQRRLAGARQAKENSRIAFWTNIGRAMHRHHRIERQQIVEQAEDRLLHLAGISGAADQDQLLGQVDRDDGFAARSVAGGISLEARQIDDRIFRGECRQFVGLGPDQHRADEQIVPGQLVDDAHIHAMFRLRTTEQILHKERVLLGERGNKVGLERGKMIRGHGNIGLAPPDAVFGFAVTHDELVIG